MVTQSGNMNNATDSEHRERQKDEGWVYSRWNPHWREGNGVDAGDADGKTQVEAFNINRRMNRIPKQNKNKNKNRASDQQEKTGERAQQQRIQCTSTISIQTVQAWGWWMVGGLSWAGADKIPLRLRYLWLWLWSSTGVALRETVAGEEASRKALGRKRAEGV